jgi:hypothetical protein
MKTLLLFLMLLSLALPGRAVQQFSTGATAACGAMEGKFRCSCCEAGQCPCAVENDNSPVPPQPAPAPPPGVMGDPVFMVCTEDFTLAVSSRPPCRKSAALMGAARALRAPPVPLYRWHCAMLW